MENSRRFKDMGMCDCHKQGSCLDTKDTERCKCRGNEANCDFYTHKQENSCKKPSENTIESIRVKVDKSSDIIQELSRNLVEKYCVDLDELMYNISQVLNADSVSDKFLEDSILNLANTLYFTCSAQEDLGIKEDACKMIRQEVYFKARENASGTVADKTARAELIAQQETITLAIYSRAYKKVKLRMDAGYEMLNSLQKVMNKRITEMELSNSRYINHSEGD